MSPSKPSSRSRAAQTGSDKPKAAKPRAARKTKPAAGKTAKPRVSKAAKPRASEAAEQQLELIASPAPQTLHRPAPTAAPSRPHAASVPRPIAPTPEPEERHRGWLLIVLIPLLMLGSFWIGRVSTPRSAEETPVPAPASSTPAAAASTPSQVVAIAPQTTAPAKPAVTGTAALRRGLDTSLVEVSVGTTSRGGLTLRFDHPVAWQMNAAGMGDGELDVQGVRALGTFPRNLPLPPGVTSIRAGISAETLKLGFGLQPGIRVYTVPGSGPAAALNIYFRTPDEETAALAESGTSDAGACGASASPQAVKAMPLLQQSLDKNPGYAAVRQTLALLETCAGDGAKAEQLLAATGKDGGNGVKLTVTDVALRYARGDIDGALKALKDGMPAGDAGYQELLADLEAARQP